jgi:hypothetical protein
MIVEVIRYTVQSTPSKDAKDWVQCWSFAGLVLRQPARIPRKRLEKLLRCDPEQSECSMVVNSRVWHTRDSKWVQERIIEYLHYIVGVLMHHNNV